MNHETAPAAVLKLREPNFNQRSEAHALKNFNGRGTARLLDSTSEIGAILLERITPGETLYSCVAEVDDDEIVAGVLEQIAGVPGTEGLRSAALQLRTWADAVDHPPESGLMTAEQFKVAGTLLRELADTQEGDNLVTVHGDLHTGNILTDERSSWRAVDPKGFAGTPNFDAGWWASDPTEKTDYSPTESFLRRVDVISNATGIDRIELAAWAFAFRSVVLVARIRSNVGWDMKRAAVWLQTIWETGMLKRT